MTSSKYDQCKNPNEGNSDCCQRCSRCLCILMALAIVAHVLFSLAIYDEFDWKIGRHESFQRKQLENLEKKQLAQAKQLENLQEQQLAQKHQFEGLQFTQTQQIDILQANQNLQFGALQELAQSQTTTECRICLRETERSAQFQQSTLSCSGWSTTEQGKWTESFHDDTDNRTGGCRKSSWMVECRQIPKTIEGIPERELRISELNELPNII